MDGHVFIWEECYILWWHFSSIFWYSLMFCLPKLASSPTQLFSIAMSSPMTHKLKQSKVLTYKMSSFVLVDIWQVGVLLLHEFKRHWLRHIHDKERATPSIIESWLPSFRCWLGCFLSPLTTSIACATSTLLLSLISILMFCGLWLH